MYHKIPVIDNPGLAHFFVSVHNVVLTMPVSNASFRHDLIVCLSKAIRDAVIQEKEHSISEKCRKQLRVEKEEEVSQIFFWWRSGSLDNGTRGEWGWVVALCSWTVQCGILIPLYSHVYKNRYP